MLKKIFIMFITIILLVGICGSVNATELKTTLDVIQQASETKYLENDQGYISKTIVDSNAEMGEVTIELKLSNTKKETNTNGSTEVFFVIDNSPSMELVTDSGKVRKNLIINSAKTLASSIFKQSSSVKIGTVKFTGNGNFSSIGLNNATLVQSLSDNETTVLSGIQKVADSSTSSGTNIDAGLQKANNNFSNDCKNKIIVLFTDGVPTCDVKGTNAGNDTTTEESLTAQANTKATIQNLSNSGVYLISMMTGLDPEADEYNNDLLAITNIFGTANNPTAGKFYNIKDADIEEIVNNNILADVIEKIQNSINTVKIVDYFPEDITKNFEFSYVGSANTGIASKGIDEETKTISWDIGTLKGEEVAKLKYRLKIKDMQNTDLLNKTIATNEKVVLTYKDKESKDYTIELTSSPKIQLSEVKEGLTATVTYNPTTNTTGKVTATIKTNKKVNEVESWTISEDGMKLTKEYTENATETIHLVDMDNMTKDIVVKITNIVKEEPKQPEDDTTATGKLPQTGVSATIIISLMVVTVISIIIYKKYNSYKDIK